MENGAGGRGDFSARFFFVGSGKNQAVIDHFLSSLSVYFSCPGTPEESFGENHFCRPKTGFPHPLPRKP
jgi:hypothetical protein